MMFNVGNRIQTTRLIRLPRPMLRLVVSVLPGPELVMGWVHPWVGLGWVRVFFFNFWWVGLGWLET